MATDEPETVETENGFEITPEDAEHISRLRAMRDSGAFNMMTEARQGLTELFGPEEGRATYEWQKEHFDLFTSGDWVDCELPEADDEEATA